MTFLLFKATADLPSHQLRTSFGRELHPDHYFLAGFSPTIYAVSERLSPNR